MKFTYIALNTNKHDDQAARSRQSEISRDQALELIGSSQVLKGLEARASQYGPVYMNTIGDFEIYVAVTECHLRHENEAYIVRIINMLDLEKKIASNEDLVLLRQIMLDAVEEYRQKRTPRKNNG